MVFSVGVMVALGDDFTAADQDRPYHRVGMHTTRASACELKSAGHESGVHIDAILAYRLAGAPTVISPRLFAGFSSGQWIWLPSPLPRRSKSRGVPPSSCW